MIPPASPGIATTLPADGLEPAGRWRVLFVLSIGILLAEAPWFSSAAVTPLLRVDWRPEGLELAMLTVAVQLGFAAGALLLAASGAADVIRGDRLFFWGAVVTGAGNLGFAWLATDPGSALPFRFLTGAGIAAVYPVGMKLIAGWFRVGRGAAIGILLGALAVGTALPHLLGAFGTVAGADWRMIVTWASIAAFLGGVAVLAGAPPGPFDAPAPRFSFSIAARAFREPSVRLANLGYLGHMWELFAMWTWVPLFLAASLAASGSGDASSAALAAFVVIAAGGIGCAAGGILADRFGRTTLTIAAMGSSGACCLLIGFLYGGPPVVVLGLAIVWGITVVADSPQFSAAVSELAPTGTAGSALAMQTAVGFVLTAATILSVGALDPGDGAGWRIAFGSLALGPLVGVVAMWRLRGRPDATKMAGGRR
ncbi:MAG TPA: MFS transporter [Candidatus Sulfomarinibacteraceae bacterium]|nr:MFS transporter [Candidatus Sulfomarinibacteraceae bacterium]